MHSLRLQQSLDDVKNQIQSSQKVELETRIVAKIRDVMLALGYGFAFIGNQYRILANETEYFVDLLFSNQLPDAEQLKETIQREFVGLDLPETHIGEND